MSGHRIGLRMEADVHCDRVCRMCRRAAVVSPFRRAGSVNEIAELREKVAVSTTTPQVKIALELLLHADVFSPHSFRATASALLNEHGYLPDVIEWQLAHQERNGVRASGNHTTYLCGRRQMAQEHADMLDGTLKWMTRSNSEQNEVCKSAFDPSLSATNDRSIDTRSPMSSRKMFVGGRSM